VKEGRVCAPSARARNVPPELDEICRRALARDRDERFATAGEMQEALESFTRRVPFSGRHMARWMKETFPDEQAQMQRLLLEAKRRPPGEAPDVAAPVSEVFVLDLESVARPVSPEPGAGASPEPSAASPERNLATAELEQVTEGIGPAAKPARPARLWPQLVGFLVFVAMLALVAYLMVSRCAPLA
jgi:serine/threonine-protein kinase